MKCNNCKKEYNKFKEEEKIFKNGIRHIGAYCPLCDHFVKWLSQGCPDLLYFGKYKGKPIEEVAIEDRDYLLWLIENLNNPKLDKKIKKYL